MTPRDPNTDPDYQFVKQNWDSLIAQYRAKYIVVSGQTVCGFYDTYEAAADYAVNSLGSKQFIIHHMVDRQPTNFIWASSRDLANLQS